MATDINAMFALYESKNGHLDEALSACPASSFTRLLRLKKLKEHPDGKYAEAASQMPVYLRNTAWYGFLISQIDEGNDQKVEDHFAVSVPSEENNNEEIIETAPVVPIYEQEEIEPIIPEDQTEKEDTNTFNAIEAQYDEEQVTDEPDLKIEEGKTDEHSTEITISQHIRQDAELPENQQLFEPLHTVDFFASQGIHLKEEDLEKDQLGRQLKSFTGWLKSMKKLHPGKLPEQDEVIEKIIQASAEVSNNEVDVLTEAMAEVLVKQNKKAKAIEMYNKLSLMNPTKSAYFAAKIESLKTD